MSKVAIVGTGLVGSTFAFSLMMSGLVREMVLIDHDKNLAEGHAMDLNHGIAFARPIEIRAGDYPDCKGAQVVVITAGKNQRPGETRLDLVKANVEVFREIIPEIRRHNPECILLVVTNPVDILTYVTLKLSGSSPSMVIGSGTMLDSARFRYILSQHCGIDPRSIHAYVIGEHGDSEVPLWSSSTIGGITFRKYCPVCRYHCDKIQREKISDRVRRAAYEIIERKKATHYAIGLSLVRIMSSIIGDERSVLTISTLIDDYYGVEDLCMSLPAIVDGKGVHELLRPTLSGAEKRAFKKSADILKGVLGEIELPKS